MRAGWLITLAAGAAIGVAAPSHVEAQGNSNRARQQVERQREQDRDRTRREEDRRERERLERLANERGMVIRRSDDRHRDDRRNDRYDRRNDRYDPRDIYDRRNDRYDRRGPAFCRNGEGHPVHGRQWCRNKGFGLGNDRSRDIWGDIIYRDRRYDNRMMNQSVLERILGSVVLNRFGDYGRTYYGNGSLNGRWLDNRATTLQLYMGSTPIARLIDTNRDGRVDSVSLIR